MNEKVYELVIKDQEDEVFAISLVTDPAIQRDFIAFDKEEVKLAVVDKEKQMLIGPIMRSDMKILRVDANNKPYYVFFSKDTVKKLAQNYLKKGYQNNTTVQHKDDVQGVSLVESWMVESPLKDKSAIYNLSLKEGDWCGVFKVDNQDIWDNYIKTGELKGFSVEGIFEHVPIQNSIEEIDIMDKDINELTQEELKIAVEKIIKEFNV